MDSQYIVFGADRFGASVARTLENAGCQTVVVDRNEERIRQIADDVSYALTADAENPEVMDGLGLDHMDGAVISFVDEMEASIVTAMTCKERGVKKIIARAKNEIHGRILEKIGVDRIVYPEQEMGTRIGKYLTAQEFSEWIALSPEYSIVEMVTPSLWEGKSLADLGIRQKYGMNVVGVRRGKEMDLTLSPTEPLKKGMTLYVIGRNRDLERFQKK